MSDCRHTSPTVGAGRGRGFGARSQRGRGIGRGLPGNVPKLQETQAALPYPRAAAGDQYADTEEDSSPISEINLIISGLPHQVRKEEIKAYFGRHMRGDTAEVVDVLLLGSGKAKVVISGLTEEEMRKLQAKRHAIQRQAISLEVKSSTLVPYAAIIVTGFADTIDKYLLELYFENSKSGGCEGAVEQCIIVSPGTAYVTFKHHEVAAQVISKPGGHSFSGSPLRVRYYDESESMEGYESNRLRLHKLPPGTQQFPLQLYIGRTLQMKQPQDFTCEVAGQSAVIVFSQDHSSKELLEMITKIKTTPLRGAAIEAELCPIEDEEESCKMVTLKLSALPRGTTKEHVEAYLETLGDSVEVLSIEFQGPGSAKIVLSGLTAEEVKRLQEKKHKIKKQQISMKVMEIAAAVEMGQSDREGFPTLPTTITVSGFPDTADEELLKMYFESPDSGGCEGAVEQNLIVTKGIAHVKFHSPDIAAQVISKPGGHSFSGSPLRVRYYDESEPMEGYESNRLRLHKLPPGTQQFPLQLYIGRTLQMKQPQDFTCEVAGQSAVIVFSQDHSGKELLEMITKIKTTPLRGAAIEAELCPIEDEEESCKMVTLKLSALPRGTTKEHVEAYLETLGDSVEVLSIEFQGPGSAKIVLSGLTAEEVKRLQERKHKIKKQQISMEIMEIAAAVEMGQSDHEGFPTLPTTITVSGFPDTADEELLKMYFESPDSGGCEGAVEQNLIVTKGIAHVKFHSPDIAAQVISKPGGHSFSGSPLRVRYYDESEGYESNRLRLHKLPPGTQQFPLQLYLGRTLQMKQPQDFTCEVAGQSAVIVFSQDHSGKELLEMITKIKTTPLRGAAIEAELCPIEDEEESCKMVTLKLSALPRGTTKEHVEAYLETLGDSVEVLSIEFQGPGSAKIVLSGLTAEEVKRLQEKKHKIKKQQISMKVMEIAAAVEMGQSDHEGFPTLPTTITVSGFPDTADEELLKVFFESPDSGGCEGAVEQCSIVTKGIAHVKFHSPDIAAQVISKPGDHFLSGSSLCVRYYDESEPMEGYESNRLRVHKLPPGTQQDFLQLYLGSALRMQHPQDFTCEVAGQSAVITFSQDHSGKVLSEMVAKLKSKQMRGACIEAELCRVTSSIRVSNITEHYEEDYLRVYFENPMTSGGGKVTSVELLGNGQAVVIFNDPKVLNTTLKRTHDTFGAGVDVRREDPFELVLQDPTVPTSMSLSLTHTSIPPLKIKVDPLVVESLKKAPKSLEGCVQKLHVEITFDSNIGIIQVVPTKLTRANWRDECEQHLTTHVNSKYIRKERKIPEEAGFDIKSFLLTLPKETPIALSFNRDGTLLTTAGECGTMDMFHHQVEEICSAHEQTEEKQTLTPEQYCYFAEIKQAEVVAAHPEVKITMNPDIRMITLQGSVKNVKRSKHLLTRFVAHTSLLVQLKDPLIVQYLSTEDGRQHLSNFLQMKQCQVAVHFKQVSLTGLSLHFLCDESQTESARGCANSLPQQTSVNSFPLPESFVSMLPELEDYDDLCRNLEKQFHVQVITMGQQVSIAGFESGVTGSTQSLNEFIQEKCTVTKTIEIDEGKWRLFCNAMNITWRSMLDQIQRENVKVIVPSDETAAKPQIVLKGDRIQVEKECHLITELVKSVAMSSFSLSRPGTCKFFRESAVMISGIEHKEKVAIEFKESDGRVRDANDITDTASPPKFIKVCVARTVEAKEIFLYVGDIAEFTKAEVLVNAANGQLRHGAGVAKAIADKGGPVIQRESKQYVQKRGPLDDGDIWFTKKVGKLPCKALIHAVGPRFQGGRKNEEALLYKACYGSLLNAQKFQSIAIPAIGAGIFNFPMDRSAETLIRAAVEFSKKNPGSSMQEINFILLDQNDVDTFVTVLKKYIQPESIFETPVKQPVSPPVSQPTVVITPSRSSKESKKKQIAPVATPSPIQLHSGSLLNIKADVYINSTNHQLNLSQGAVAQALAKAAGPALQDECNKKAPIQDGEIAVTGAGKLPCRHVFHVVAPKYDGAGGKAEKVLCTIVQKCMKEGDKLGVTSIAFPALGAGNLRFPPDVVAKIMVGEISHFLSSKKSTTLTAVHLVIFMKDTYQAFQKELAPNNDMSDTPSPLQPATVGHHEPAFHTLPILSGVSPQITSQGVQGFPFGNIMVQIDKGDITEDSSDAVVNTTNKSLQLNLGGVSTALLKKGGPELQRECDKITSRGTRLQEGDVIPTPATGSLKCKSVFHTAFESPDPTTLMNAINACLQKAEDLQYQSIAFPAIGTGIYGYTAKDVAQSMQQVIQRFSSSKQVHLANIRIVLFKKKVYQEFLSTFQDEDSTSQHASLTQATPNPGFIKRGFNWLGSFLPSSDTDDSKGTTVPNANDESMHKELEVRIYGENESYVQNAEELLHKIIQDQFVTERVHDPNITNLSQGQIRKLEVTSRELEVELDINPEPLNYIRLRGEKGDVSLLMSEVRQTLAQLEKHASKMREAKHMQRLVQWKRQDPNSTWTKYDTIINFEMEQAFKQGQAQHHHQDHDKSEWFTIDFKKMEEKDHLSQDTYKVHRVDLEQQYREGDSRPHHWVPMPADPTTKREDRVYIVDLDPGCSEYQGALKMFHETMTPGLEYKNIIKIQRIQNPTLYGQYIARKKEMDKQNCQGHQNERRLFHGTSADTVPKINKQGFNRSYAGKNATVIGEGVYFARDAAYSARYKYSRPDSNECKYMFIAQVLTGEFARGAQHIKAPPPKDPLKDPNLLLDSVVDNLSNPGIFVIFSDSQAYPEHLITFK